MPSYTDFDVELFKRAELGPRHVVAFVPVHRGTASQWLNGKQRPSHLLRREVVRLQKAIRAAVDAGELPITNRSLSSAERGLREHAVIRRALDNT